MTQRTMRRDREVKSRIPKVIYLHTISGIRDIIQETLQLEKKECLCHVARITTNRDSLTMALIFTDCFNRPHLLRRIDCL